MTKCQLYLKPDDNITYHKQNHTLYTSFTNITRISQTQQQQQKYHKKTSFFSHSQNSSSYWEVAQRNEGKMKRKYYAIYLAI